MQIAIVRPQNQLFSCHTVYETAGEGTEFSAEAVLHKTKHNADRIFEKIIRIGEFRQMRATNTMNLDTGLLQIDYVNRTLTKVRVELVAGVFLLWKRSAGRSTILQAHLNVEGVPRGVLDAPLGYRVMRAPFLIHRNIRAGQYPTTADLRRAVAPFGTDAEYAAIFRAPHAFMAGAFIPNTPESGMGRVPGRT